MTTQRSRRYAEGTRVPADRSLAQIRQELQRFGASKFAVLEQADTYIVAFEFREWRVRFALPVPADDERERCRRLRSLYAVLKAKLVAVDDGIRTFEQEFLASLVMPGGATVEEAVLPRLRVAWKDGRDVPLLGA